MTAQTIRCRLKGYAAEPSAASVEVRDLSPAQRLLRSGKQLAIWWGAALVSLFIPVAHLLLVPGFTVFGIVMAVRAWKTDRLLLGAHGTCPDCGAEQDLDLSGRWTGATEVPCRHCHRTMRLTPTPP